MIQALNVCANTPVGTPYGDQIPYGEAGYTDITNALNWALKWQHEPDPASRSPTGGPTGVFIPYVPALDPGLAWHCTGPVFVPNRRGIYLLGERHIPGITSSSAAGASLIRFNRSGDNACIINQANTFVMRDLTLYTQSAGDTCIVNTRVTSTGHPNYVADNGEGFGTGSTNTGQIQSRLQMTQCGISGFDLGIQNGALAGDANCDHHTLEKVYFFNCDVCWHNVNDQGVNISWRDCEALSCPVVAKFSAGGHFIIDHFTHTTSGGKLLQLTKGGALPLELGPGLNNGYFVLKDIKTDTQATDGGWLVYMEDETEWDRLVTVVIDGGMNSRRMNGGSALQQNRFARMVGRSRLVIQNHSFPGQIECFGGDPEGAYPDASWKPGITMIGCTLGQLAETNDPTTLIAGDGEYNFLNVIGCDSIQTGAAVVTPRRVDDLPDKPTQAEVTAEIAAADYTTPAEAQSLIDAVDWQIINNVLPSNAVVVSGVGTDQTTPLPKAGQARSIAYNIAGGPFGAGKSLADVTSAEVVLLERLNSGTVYRKNSVGDAASVVLDTSAGTVTVNLVASDFAADKLKAGINYFVVIKLTIAGVATPIEIDAKHRLLFTFQQDP